MGVNKGGEALYCIKKLSFTQLHSLACSRAEDAGQKGRPAAAVDMNWLCNHLKQCGGVVETASFIEGFLTHFISEGTRIIAVFDPENRHHSKKASIVRVYDRNKAVLDAIRYKSRILANQPYTSRRIVCNN